MIKPLRLHEILSELHERAGKEDSPTKVRSVEVVGKRAVLRRAQEALLEALRKRDYGQVRALTVEIEHSFPRRFPVDVREELQDIILWEDIRTAFAQGGANHNLEIVVPAKRLYPGQETLPVYGDRVDYAMCTRGLTPLRELPNCRPDDHPQWHIGFLAHTFERAYAVLFVNPRRYFSNPLIKEHDISTISSIVNDAADFACTNFQRPSHIQASFESCRDILSVYSSAVLIDGVRPHLPYLPASFFETIREAIHTIGEEAPFEYFHMKTGIVASLANSVKPDDASDITISRDHWESVKTDLERARVSYTLNGPLGWAVELLHTKVLDDPSLTSLHG